MRIKLPAIGLLVFFGFLTHAFAELSQLKKPSVALPTGYLAARPAIEAALNRPDCKFLGGSSLNSFTSLGYGGDTKALNLFLDDLAKCPGATVSVSFVSERIPFENCDWYVSHEAHPNRFHVMVNLKSPNIKLDTLYIPEAKGPALPAAK